MSIESVDRRKRARSQADRFQDDRQQCCAIVHDTADDTPGSGEFDVWRGSSDSVATFELQHTLLALASIANSLSPDHFNASLDHALDLLRDATGADSAELFLAEPNSHDLLLTAFRGPYWRAFCEATRFAPGHGFPGRVLQSGTPVASSTLSSDPRFLRSAVTSKGFRAYVCVPLMAGNQVIGTVSLGSRQTEFSTSDALRVLTWSSGLLTSVIQAGTLRASRIALPERPIHSDDSSDIDLLLDALLQQVLTLSEADAAAITLGGRGTTPLIHRVSEGFAIESLMSCPMHGDAAHTCPAIDDELGVALWGPRRDWPETCQQLPRAGRASYCLPLRHGDRAIGLIQLVYQVAAPRPPTQPLGLLHEFAAHAAELLVFFGEPGARMTAITAVPELAESPPRNGPATGARQSAFEPLEQNARLHIRCFGPCEITWDRSPISPSVFTRRKALTLLKILVLHSEQPVSRDAIIEWLWPDSDPDSGANRLHGIVHALRQVIEPPAARGEWRIVQNADESYLFQPLDPYWLDLTAFRLAIDAGEHASERGDIELAIARFEEATTLYRGELFSDEPYADWCMIDREVHREIYLTALERLAGLLAMNRSHDRVIDVCRQLIRHDPLREPIQQLLIESLWRNGRRDEALRHYDRFLKLLRVELQADPLPETIALLHRLRSEAAH